LGLVGGYNRIRKTEIIDVVHRHTKSDRAKEEGDMEGDGAELKP